MRYTDFENTMSPPRMTRYLTACGNSSKKAMTLYRKNLRLSQELFTVISCFEITLRNKIDVVYSAAYGNHWLRDSAATGGVFDRNNCKKTQRLINNAFTKLGHNYTHHKLIAEMDFGFWRYLYAQPQFYAGGQMLLRVFPAKPRSTTAIQYNQRFIFNELEQINDIRNRIAHHEPICFLPSQSIKNTTYARQRYNRHLS